MASPDEISPQELRQKLERGEDILLLDIRSPQEYEICHIEGSILLPSEEVFKRYEELPRDKEIVIICHHGVRSEAQVVFLRGQGFKAHSLKGGINLWAFTVEPDMAQY